MTQPDSKTLEGIIFDIKRFALHDGPGIRTTVFLKGCPLKCWWCHNPESLKQGIEKDLGQTRQVRQIIKEIQKEVIFYDQSRGGVTFSGGEPLSQPLFLQALLDQCRSLDIHTALDTTGCVSPEIFNPFITKTDLFLYDLKLMDRDHHIRYTRVPNDFILENLKTLSRSTTETIIRFPVIPGITDTDANIKAMASFIASLNNTPKTTKSPIKRIDLLPFHNTAEGKYKRLDIENKMKGVPSPTPESIDKIRHIFQDAGLTVKTELPGL